MTIELESVFLLTITKYGQIDYKTATMIATSKTQFKTYSNLIQSSSITILLPNIEISKYNYTNQQMPPLAIFGQIFYVFLPNWERYSHKSTKSGICSVGVDHCFAWQVAHPSRSGHCSICQSKNKVKYF